VSVNNGVLDSLYRLVGRGAVLLPIPKGTKKPVMPGWEQITFHDTQGPDYRARLQSAINVGGNIGVRQGKDSDNLRSIDIDGDSDVEPFLYLNPRLRGAPRTRGARGCQIHVRIQNCPTSINYIKHTDGSKWGELRGGPGSQSIIYGVHPGGHRYETLVDQPVFEIDFKEIIWPDGLILPWVKSTSKNPRQRILLSRP
jgi:hypothetical protein